MSSSEAKTQLLPRESVKRDKRLQVRLGGVNPDCVEAYTLSLQRGEEFPPLVVFRVDGELLLADGYHRFAAYEGLGVEEVSCEVYDGDWLSTVDYTRFQANRKNGQRLSRSDLQAVVRETVSDPRFQETSSNKLAELLGVAPQTVRKAREEVFGAQTPTGWHQGVENPLSWHDCSPPAGPERPEHDGFPVLTRKVALRLVERLEELEASLEKLEPLSEWLDEGEAQALVGVGERVVHLAEGAL